MRAVPGAGDTMTPKLNDLNPQEQADLQQLLQRAEAGDRTALPELHQALDRLPEIWQQFGNLGQHALHAWITLIAGSNLLLAAALTRKVEELRQQLAAGAAGSPLEQLLIEQIVCCWLQTRHVDTLMAQGQAVATAKQI